MDNENKIKMETDFTDKIKQIHYDQTKNLIFVSCRDGKFKCWKLPRKWVKDDDY